MQYVWTDGGAATSSDVARRWMEVVIFLQDGSNKTYAVYDIEKETFCRYPRRYTDDHVNLTPNLAIWSSYAGGGWLT